jgi:hypothetical protein
MNIEHVVVLTVALDAGGTRCPASGPDNNSLPTDSINAVQAGISRLTKKQK